MPMPVAAQRISALRDDHGHDPSRQLRLLKSQVPAVRHCRIIKGQVDGIGTQPRLRVKGADEAILIDRTYAPEAVGDVSSAIGIAASWLKETQNLAPVAVGHRVVHGGPNYDRPVLVDDRVL